MLRVIPLLVLVVGLYNVLALLTNTVMTTPVFSLAMPSGDSFDLNTAELLLVLGLLLLYLELLKATRSGSACQRAGVCHLTRRRGSASLTRQDARR